MVFLGMLFLCYMVAVVVSLTLESPMMAVEKALLTALRSKKGKTDQTHTSRNHSAPGFGQR